MNIISWEKYEFEFQKYESDDESDEFELDDVGEQLIDIGSHAPVVMQTPFGLFRVDDSMNPFKRFDFRMGHTNFDITPTVMNTIQQIPGVEVLIVNTRYRFIVATAKLFEFSDVRIAIERELCGQHQVEFLLKEIKNPVIKERATTVHKEISSKKYWAMYIFPNGAIEHTSDNEMSDKFINDRNLYTHAIQISDGILITNENEYK